MPIKMNLGKMWGVIANLTEVLTYQAPLEDQAPDGTVGGPTTPAGVTLKKCQRRRVESSAGGEATDYTEEFGRQEQPSVAFTVPARVPDGSSFQFADGPEVGGIITDASGRRYWVLEFNEDDIADTWYVECRSL